MANQKLLCWFGLSYASFLVLPRVLMEAMPDEWQDKIAGLLEEYDSTYPNQPDVGTRVQFTKNKKLIKTPVDFINYRRPNQNFIERMKNART